MEVFKRKYMGEYTCRVLGAAVITIYHILERRPQGDVRS